MGRLKKGTATRMRPRIGNATPLPASLPEPGSVMICRGFSPTPPLPPTSTLLPSSEIADSLPNHHLPQTLLLSTTEINCQPIWHRFQQQGGESTQYTEHSTQYTVHTFSWLLFSFAAESSASSPNQEKSHTTPSSIYLHIIG
jgi:hypothetical protein